MVKRRTKKPIQRVMPFPLRLGPQLRAKLQRYADDDRRALSNYLLIVLEKHVAEMESKTPPA